MPATLTSLTTALSLDPGLQTNVSATDREAGLQAAAAMNALLLRVIEARGLNADGRIRPEELQQISAAIQANPTDYQIFLDGHGNDEGTIETGFHLVQNDGGSLLFRGRNFVDTVADAIYHYGFNIIDGRYVNEDGNANETALDVAGWLNYFLNGESTVYGTTAAETLNSGDYSEAFAAARNETFLAGAGNDSIWADLGNDTVYGGEGNDRSGGGFGQDLMFGEAGDDRLSGEGGNDTLYGGDGNDTLNGGAEVDYLLGGAGNDKLWSELGSDFLAGGIGDDELGMGDGNDYATGDLGNDTMYGDAGNDAIFGGDGTDVINGGIGNDGMDGGTGADRVSGDVGNDTVYGGAGNDNLSGGQGTDALIAGDGNDTVSGDEADDRMNGEAGNDLLYGGDGQDIIAGGIGADSLHGGTGVDVLYGMDGNDSLSGGEGGDNLIGGTGRDVITLWETVAMRDTIIFANGDSGRTLATIDRIEGFDSGLDKIDLRAFGRLTFEDIDFSDLGASCYYDGRFLRIDANGDRATDMMVEFAWVDALVASDFILA